MKKIIICGVWLCFLTLMPGCGEKSSEHMKVGVLRTIDSVPLYLADKENFFEEAGVKVELVEFGSASDQSKAMEAGELDGMMTDMVVQNLIQKGGMEMRTVAGMMGKNSSEGRFVIVSAPDSSIKKPEDLAGKRIAVSKGTMMEYLADSYLGEFGIDSTEVIKEQVPKLSLRLDMVLAGSDIDAAVLPDPLAFLAEAEGAHTVIDDTGLSKNLSQSVIAFRKEALDTKGSEVRKFLLGLDKAKEALNDDPHKYIQDFQEIANVPDEIIETYQIPAYTTQWVPEEEEVSGVLQWMTEAGLLDNTYTYEEVVDSSFLTIREQG